jgi:hypothetical protein
VGHEGSGADVMSPLALKITPLALIVPSDAL